MKRNEIEQLLQDLGYQIEYRKTGWKECLVAGHGEAWLGHGLTGEEALGSAIRSMFPSQGATSLLEKAVASLAQETSSKAPKIVAPPPEPEPTPAPPQEPKKVREDGSVRKRAGTPKVVAEAVPEEPPRPRPQTYVDPRVEAEATETPVAAVTPAVKPKTTPNEDAATREEAFARLGEILDEIDDEADDIAVMTTMNQRFNIGSWIFQARCIEEAHENDQEVTEAVHQIALRLTGLCKVGWPGSVRALQIWTKPSQALEGFARPSSPPSTWARATEIMEEQIERLTSRSGHDEYGWRDAMQVLPEPAEPAAVLREAVERIEVVLGPLTGSPEDKKDKIEEEQALEGLEDLVLAAHLLRWIRRCCTSRKRWGLAMGTLRWVAKEYRPAMQPLQEIIDDNFMPPSSWAELLGRDPRVNEEHRLQREIMDQKPEADWPEEDLLDWLHRAFRVFANPQIAKMAEAVRDPILALTNEDFADADRSTRTRLRKLQTILRVEEDVSEVELPSAEDLADAEASDSAPIEVVVDPATLLLERVRPFTEGKHMLFVSNRDDEHLRKRLEKDLGCSVTLKNGSTVRQMRAIMDGISPTRYDYVVMATGFNRHDADTNLCRVAKAAGIPYLRVNKGRPLATVRALARSLNVKMPDESNGASVASVG